MANIATRADKVDGGWVLNGAKAYSTNAAISDHAIVTAVSDPEASRNSRLSLFIVDLRAEGVTRKPLSKRVWTLWSRCSASARTPCGADSVTGAPRRTLE